MKNCSFAHPVFKKSFLFSILVLVFILNNFAIAHVYDVMDLGALSENGTSRAFAINDNHQIVGYTSSGENSIACLFELTGQSVNITNLGTLEGCSSSLARSINDDGTIVGWLEYDAFNIRACTFDKAGSPALIGSYNYCVASAINSDGTIVGKAGNASNAAMAYNFTSSSSLASSNSSAMSINDLGVIVGSVQEGSFYKAYIFGQEGNLAIGGNASYALSVNNNNQIVGNANIGAGIIHAFVFDETGGLDNTDLGALGGTYSSAASINDAGAIVGYAQITNGENRACLFDSSGNGENIDLNTLINPALGWTLQDALDISNDGWIVGVGIHNGVERAFLLKPVPEPATVVIFAMGISLFASKRKQLNLRR